MSPPPLTLGTAGHIDHGKTALIRALTGSQTDRLPQERERGISIELGYARLELPTGRQVSVIDVPGHERFVRTMVAGATGIDLYLMTIAADDGVMPQTREHAAVLRALRVEHGVVAVTKSDLADPAAAIREASALLPGATAVPVSARTGTGLGALCTALEAAAARAPGRADLPGPVRLHLDRVFTIRGAGTVVTGTLWSGTVAPGDRVEVLPRAVRARVRSVQIHDEAVTSATAGQRVALNLSGVAVADVAKGDVLVGVGAELCPTYVVDCELELEPDREPEHGQRVQVHHGTRESPARLAWLGGRFWQVRLEQPIIAARGDRLVVRQIAPPDTLGGGRVLDAAARKHGPRRDVLAALQAMAAGAAAEHAPPGLAGGPPMPSPTPGALPASAIDLERRLLESGLQPPLDSELDPGDLAALRARGRAVRVSKTLHYHPHVLSEVRERLVALAQTTGGALTLSGARDELGTSRKFAQALLEHLDSERVFIRRGEQHALRRSATAPASAPPRPGSAAEGTVDSAR